MKVKIIRECSAFGRVQRLGSILDISPGAADVLVKRRRPAVAEYCESEAVQTLVPAIPGLSQVIDAVSQATRGRKPKHVGS